MLELGGVWHGEQAACNTTALPIGCTLCTHAQALHAYG